MAISVKETLFWIKAAVSSAGAAWFALHRSLLDGISVDDMRAGAGVIAQLSGTMLGFVLAALAILLTVVNTRLIRNMQRTGHYGVLLRRMLVCLLAFGVATLSGAAYLFAPSLTLAWCCALIGVSLFAVITLADVCFKFWTVLHNLTPT